jgi:hypothetical protein
LYYEGELNYLFEKFLKGVAQGMVKVDLKTQKKTEIEDSSSLKGTLASVFLLGIFLVVTWVSVYFLFLDRF